MPIKKNPEWRLREIVRLLNAKHSGIAHKAELMRRCAVSERTIKGDIAQLRAIYGVNIKHEKKQDGYRLLEPFEFPDLPISFQDFARLKIAVATLSQLRHLDIFKDLETTLDKIEKAVKLRTSSTSAANQIYFEPVPYYGGTGMIPLFLQAIDSAKVICFDYHSYKSPKVRTHEIAPYFLQEFSNRWYVVGWSPEYKTIMPFALERIQGMPKIQAATFDLPKDFSRDDYFKNTYGMTRYSKEGVEDVMLSFSPLQAKYFKSKPFHEYEIVTETDEELVVKMRLMVNYELKRKILGMGIEVKVLAPLSLVEDIKRLLQEALRLYE